MGHLHRMKRQYCRWKKMGLKWKSKLFKNGIGHLKKGWHWDLQNVFECFFIAVTDSREFSSSVIHRRGMNFTVFPLPRLIYLEGLGTGKILQQSLSWYCGNQVRKREMPGEHHSVVMWVAPLSQIHSTNWAGLERQVPQLSCALY